MENEAQNILESDIINENTKNNFQTEDLKESPIEESKNLNEDENIVEEIIVNDELNNKDEKVTKNEINGIKDEMNDSGIIELANNTSEVTSNFDQTNETPSVSDKVVTNGVEESEAFVDILGNGLLTKKIIERGLGRETRPNHGDNVKIKYQAFNSENVMYEENEVSFVVGDGDMIQAFDLGICLSEKLEEFELKTDARFAFGTLGDPPHVKPNESLTFRIKLVAVDDPPDYSTFSNDDRINVVDKKRERGNYFYRREDYSLAVNSYSKALKIINTDAQHKNLASDPDKAELFDLFIKVTNNLAAAQLKLESYDSVIETCDSILTYQPDNVKALFRKGKSLSNKGNYNEAINVLRKGLEIENSKLIANEIQRCYTLKKAEDEQRARICRRMFGGDNNLDSTHKDSHIKQSTFSRFRSKAYKYSPYIGAVIVTGISIALATLAINKSRPA